jgi:hypothetical protein
MEQELQSLRQEAARLAQEAAGLQEVKSLVCFEKEVGG